MIEPCLVCGIHLHDYLYPLCANCYVKMGKIDRAARSVVRMLADSTPTVRNELVIKAIHEYMEDNSELLLSAQNEK